MKAIVHERYGPPAQVLHLRQVDEPTAADDEILVEVHAAGVAKGDWLITTGLPYLARPSYGLTRPKHRVAGLEVSGRVRSVGANVSHFDSGDAVFGWCHGAFAEHVAVPAGHLALKPANVTHAQAAAAPISGLAALQAVRDRGEVAAGQSVLVIGASGGVGSFATQIAKSLGAEVTGVASTPNVEMVRSIGADHVIDYTKDDISSGSRRYDVVIDIAGNRPISLLRRAMTERGTLVIVGGTGGRTTMGFGRTVRAMAASRFIKQRLRSLVSVPNREDLADLAELIESGEVVPVVDQAYSLDAAAEAIGRLGEGRSRGKRVIAVKPDEV